MEPITIKLDRFHFQTHDGSDPFFEMDFQDHSFEMRLSKTSRPVLVFPPPYSLEVVEGERVGPAKLERIRQALTALQSKG